MRNLSNFKGLFILKLFVIAFLSNSCDPNRSALIRNKSKMDITVQISYNRKILEGYWKKSSYLPFLQNELKEGGGILISFDTIRLIARVKLKYNEDMIIESGIRQQPNFEYFNELTIYSKDTLNIKNKDFKNNFSKNTKYLSYDLIVK